MAARVPRQDRVQQTSNMTFIHGYLLGGLLLAGVPVLLHLIMRQKPKPLRFPAFRFLRQRHLINRRKLRLQQLLLLLLRMGIIAALCLALARPRVAAERVAALFSNERPITAVLVFDTSPSMEYNSGGRTRLDDAQQRARELLDELDTNSSIAILDSADDPGSGEIEWLSPTLAQTRIENLRIHPVNAPLNRQIDRAVRLLQKAGESEDPPPRFLYLFSDRTRACWDARAGAKTPPDGIRALFVDVGVEQAKDLAIEKVEIVPPIAAPGERLRIHVTVRASGADFDTELLCQLDSEPESDRAAQQQAIQLSAGQARVFTFEREAPAKAKDAPAESTYQLTIRHQTADALPFNNSAFATFLVRERRKVLTIVTDESAAAASPPWRAWQLAMDAVGTFHCEVITQTEASKLNEKALRKYAAVCVFQTVPDAALWTKLGGYVRNGGGLMLVPGGGEIRRQQFNAEGMKAGLLPGTLNKIEQIPPDRPLRRWSGFRVQHPIPAFFQKTLDNADPDYGKRQSWPGVYSYWIVEPAAEDTLIMATYADGPRHPALLDRAAGRGHVILFTTPLDTRELDKNRYWHNYWESSFGLVLIDRACRYLAGDSTFPELNYFCGQTPRIGLPSPRPPPPWTLDGPGLAVAETNVKADEGEDRLTLPQASAAGNYAVRDGSQHFFAGCSLNVRPQESELERVPAAEIESVLGKDTLLSVGRAMSVKEALAGLRPPPVELLPWLMMVVLVVLTVEGMLAARFYRRPEAAPEMISG